MGGKFVKLVSPTLKDLFVEQLERMILEGELEPGDKLPTEREMAQETGVSLAIAHAGITHLAQLGFLRVAPRQGVFVSDYVRDGDVNTLKEVMQFTGMPLGVDMLGPIVSLRRSIETGAIRSACDNRTEQDLEFLRRIVREIEDGESAHLGESGFDFHHGIGLASKNMYYPMMIRTFKPFYVIFCEEYSEHWGTRHWVDAMAEQLRAIEEKDADKAAHLALASVDKWAESYLENAKAHDDRVNPYRFGKRDATEMDSEEEAHGRKAGSGR